MCIRDRLKVEADQLKDQAAEKFNEFKDKAVDAAENIKDTVCLLYTSPSPRDRTRSRMPSSA